MQKEFIVESDIELDKTKLKINVEKVGQILGLDYRGRRYNRYPELRFIKDLSFPLILFFEFF